MSLQRTQRRTRFRKRRRSGAAAIEFALVAPLFLLVVAGIVEFGQAFRTQHILTTASRRGARALTVDSAVPGQVRRTIEDFCNLTLGKNVPVDIDFSVNGSNGGGIGSAERGDAISVTVSVPYSAVGVALYGNFLSLDNLSATSILEHE